MSGIQPTVLHVSTAGTWRGGEQQLAYLTRELSAKNISQKVLCRSGSAMELYCTENDLLVLTATKNGAFDFSFAKAIANECKNRHYDIIHAHDSHAHTLALISHILYNCKVDLVVSRRVDFSIGSTPFSSFKYNHKSVKKVLCVSEAIRQITLKGIKDHSKVVTVHSGIDLNKFTNIRNAGILRKEFNIPDQVRIVGNVAAIAPHKDYYTFVDTAALVCKQRNDVRFFIIGDGPLKEKIKAYVSSKNLDEQIIFTGFRSDIVQILPELDVFFISSETEGLGTSILDAFACKVPVVATAAGGIPELVIHNKTGLLATVKDAQSLAQNLNMILDDDELRRSLVGNALKHLQDFSVARTAANTLSQYLAVAGIEL